MTLPVDRYVDVHVTENELIGIESDEPLHVLRMTGTGDDDTDCAVEFEVVQPFQAQATIQAFISALGGRSTVRTAVWLLVDAALLRFDRLSVDETNLSDNQFVEGALEMLGVNYAAVRLLLARGFHVVEAVATGDDVTPQLDLFQYIHMATAANEDQRTRWP